MRSTRLFGCLGLFIALAGLVSLLAWVVVRFSTPRPALVLAGQVQDFPPGEAPRLIDQDGTLFYVLNIDGDLVALYARSSRHTRCQVKWDEMRGVFVDPCLGTRFTPTGEYHSSGPPQELVQLPLEVKDGLCIAFSVICGHSPANYRKIETLLKGGQVWVEIDLR